MPKVGNISAFQLDDTDKLALSLYGRGVSVGDTALSLDTGGALLMTDAGGNTRGQGLFTGADGQANSATRIQAVGGVSFNGATWDRNRNNHSLTILASAARVAEITSAIVLHNAKGMLLVIDVTARAGATTLTPKLTAKGPITAAYDFGIWVVAAAINTGDATFIYAFYPTVMGAAALYTEKVDMALPRELQLTITPNNADSVTYSVGAYLLL